MCFEKMLWGISDMVMAGAFKPVPLCSVPLEKLSSRDYWSSSFEGKKCPLSKQKCHFQKMLVGYLRNFLSNNVNARAFKPLSLCSAPLKTY